MSIHYFVISLSKKNKTKKKQKKNNSNNNKKTQILFPKMSVSAKNFHLDQLPGQFCLFSNTCIDVIINIYTSSIQHPMWKRNY